MQIVVNIPKEAYEIIKGEAWLCCQEKFIEARQILVDAVQTDSEMLPEEHGRLIDADALEGTGRLENIGGRTVEVFYDYEIKNADTVVKAYKEEEQCRS